MRKMAKQFFTLLSAVVFALGSSGIASAEVQTFTAEGHYIMSESESGALAKEFAVKDALRKASESAGVFIMSHSQVKGGLLTADEVEAISASIIKVRDRFFHVPKPMSDGNNVNFEMIVTITADIDTLDVEKAVDRYIAKRGSGGSSMDAVSDLRMQVEQLNAEIKKLRQEKEERAQLNSNSLVDSRELLAANLLKQAVNANGVGNYQGALELLKNIDEINIQDREVMARIHEQKGLAYKSLSQYDKAVAEYSSAIELGSTSAYVYNGRGGTYYNLRRYDKAIADYSMAIALKGDFAIAYGNRGLSYYVTKQYDKAIADDTKAVELDGNYAGAYRNRGLVYSRLQQYSTAIADFTTALGLAADDVHAYRGRAWAYQSLQQYDKAVADYTMAIALDSNYPETYRLRGSAYHHLGQYDKSEADYTRAIALKSDFADGYNNRGYLYYDIGQYEKAVADYTKAIELNGNVAMYYNNRGKAYQKLGQQDKAEADFSKAKQLMG